MLALVFLLMNFLVSPQIMEQRLFYRDFPEVKIISHDGKNFHLRQLSYQKPLIVTFIFTKCRGICSPLVSSLKNAILNSREKEKYLAFILSFDPDDRLEDMKNYAEVFEVSSKNQPDIIFGIIEPERREKFLKSLEFEYKEIEGTDQYDHSAVIYALYKGKIMGMIFGAKFGSKEIDRIIKNALGDWEISYALPDPRIPYRCYGYNLSTGKFEIDIGLLLMYLPWFLGFLLLPLFSLLRNKKGENKPCM